MSRVTKNSEPSVVRSYWSALTVLLIGLLLFGCRRVEPEREPPARGAGAVRIVCATPALVEIVYALGAGDRVAAVSEFTVHPPEALGKPRIGGWMDPNREQLLTLRADLVLTQGEHPALVSFCAAHSIPVRSFRIESLADLFETAHELGRLLNLPEAAEALADRMRRELHHVSSDRPNLRAIRTAVILGRLPGSMQGLTTIGRNTFIDELLTLVGGSNIFADAVGAYPQISKESLLARNPEVIIEVNPGGWPPGARERLEQDWRALSQIEAVKNGRVYFLDDDYLLIPGPRVGEIARRFAECLRPKTSTP